MWGSNVSDNIDSGIPRESIELYPLLFRNGVTTQHYEEMHEHTHLGTFIPMGAYTDFYSVKQYIAFLLYPLVRSNVLINVMACSGLYDSVIRTGIQAGYQYNLIVYGATDSAGAITDYKNEGLSTLLDMDVYVVQSDTQTSMYINYNNGDNHRHIFGINWNKIISCFYNLIKQNVDNINKFDDMYNHLFNSRMSKWWTEYKKWMDTWYKNAEVLVKQEQLREAIKTALTKNIDVLRARVQQQQRAVQRLEDNLIDAYRELEEARERLIGTEYGRQEDDTERIYNLFNNCNNLLSAQVNGEYIELHFEAPLLNYDLDLAERWCNDSHNIFQQNEVADIMYKLLVNGKYTLMLEAYITWSTTGGYVGNYAGPQFKGCPQPHITYYNCFGDNGPEIRKALLDTNLSLALDCTNAAVSAVNLTDGPVIDRLIYWIKQHLDDGDTKCVLNNQTGEIVSIKEVNEDDSIHR